MICWLIAVLGFLIYFFSGVRWALHAMLAAALVGVVVGAIRFLSSAAEQRN
jgi:cell division protein FtsW (lipid II flippase)